MRENKLSNLSSLILLTPISFFKESTLKSGKLKVWKVLDLSKKNVIFLRIGLNGLIKEI